MMTAFPPMPESPMPHVRRQSGFVFLWLLFFVASLGVGMAAVGTVWHTAAQREKEAELLFVGDQYRRAIESFSHAVPPVGQKRPPKSLEELLLDPRFPQTLRHLRRLYADPMTGKLEWGLLKDAQGGIVGVHSLSDTIPFKTLGFPAAYGDFSGKSRHWQWRFTAAGASVASDARFGAEATGAASPEQGAGEEIAQAPVRARGDSQPPAQSDSDAVRDNRIFACQKAMELDYKACTAQAMGSAELLNSCLDEMTARHRACLEGG
jgi:hypothetical protein